METATMLKKTTMTTTLRDIRLHITWSHIARYYLGKSAAWIYSKLNGIDENGNPTDFTYNERLQLRNALYDFSERIRTAANAIDV